MLLVRVTLLGHGQYLAHLLELDLHPRDVGGQGGMRIVAWARRQVGGGCTSAAGAHAERLDARSVGWPFSPNEVTLCDGRTRAIGAGAH